jgi:hypothetical protein
VNVATGVSGSAMKFAATRLALTALAAAHLIVTIWHGELRRELAAALSPEQSFFTYLVFILVPLLAVGLLWTRHMRLALWLFLTALGASLIFSIYYRYVFISPDNIHRLPAGIGAAHARFALSAAIRALIDLASALGAAFVLGWHHGLSGTFGAERHQDVANHGSTVMSARSFAPVLEPKTQAFVDSLDAARGPLLRRSERVRGTGDFVKLRMPSGDSA